MKRKLVLKVQTEVGKNQGGLFLGALGMRIIVYWGLYWGSLFPYSGSKQR